MSCSEDSFRTISIADVRIDPELAATLAAVADEGTLDAASRRLQVTPSAVSQRLKVLEEQLGRILLVRSKPVRLTEAGGRKVGTYSGGMRRRLDIAMSLVGDPEVIYLDEPTTGLDPESRIEVWDVVKELAGGGTTVLLTTQYLDEAEQLADRIAILHEGRIIANDTLAGLKRLLPAAKVEYVEKQPTLEEIFLTLIGPSSPSTGSGTQVQRGDAA